MKNLTNYLVLHGKDTNDYAILATSIDIVQHIVEQGNIFCPHERDIDKTFSIIFAVAFNDNNPDIKKFKNFSIPVLTLNNFSSKLPIEDLNKLLDDFVHRIKS